MQRVQVRWRLRCLAIGMIIGWLTYYLSAFLRISVSDVQTSLAFLPMVVGVSLLLYTLTLVGRLRYVYLVFGSGLFLYWLWTMGMQVYYMD